METIILDKVPADPKKYYDEGVKKYKDVFYSYNVTEAAWDEIQNKLNEYEGLAIKESYESEWYPVVVDAFELYFFDCTSKKLNHA
ncbi:hypothetical protein ACIQYL_20275 [Lysinibacillus xylanilyticus]|uniref:hypothetical protein n=1 Tax=Lysinibacillus xylanilyticus TaxID=582475 RepID=UPI00381C5AEF